MQFILWFAKNFKKSIENDVNIHAKLSFCFSVFFISFRRHFLNCFAMECTSNNEVEHETMENKNINFMNEKKQQKSFRSIICRVLRLWIDTGKKLFNNTFSYGCNSETPVEVLSDFKTTMNQSFRLNFPC